MLSVVLRNSGCCQYQKGSDVVSSLESGWMLSVVSILVGCLAVVLRVVGFAPVLISGFKSGH